MPDRPLDSWSTDGFQQWMKRVLERLDALERVRHEVPDVTAAEEQDIPPSYSWQSAQTLSTGVGHRLFAERDGVIKFVRAERSAGDGTGTAEFDVYHNGTSIFPTTNRPTVANGEFVGEEVVPDDIHFTKGDSFQVDILATGGGTGPLRVTIHFIES